MKIYLITKSHMTTPGAARTIQIACLGFYSESRHAPIFIDKKEAEAYLKTHRKLFHKVKDGYKGQEWEVDEFEIWQQCRVCGCTDDNCAQCVEKTGEPCYWIELDLCSACAKGGAK